MREAREEQQREFVELCLGYLVGVPSSNIFEEESTCGVVDPPVSYFPLGPSQPHFGLLLLLFVTRTSGSPAVSQ